MIESVIKSFAKKYLLKSINKFITKVNDRVDMEQYRLKIIQIMKFLNNLLSYLDDKKIDDEEADKIIAESKNLF